MTTGERSPHRDAGAYPRPPLPPDEPQRLEALQRYDILDTPPDQAFDDLTHIAAHICATPVALVTLVDSHRQWFKARHGFDRPETPRDMAFCAHAIAAPGTLVVADAMADERFARNPLVLGHPEIRFYAGAPLRVPGGHAVGTLCVIDRRPRALEPAQQAALEALARQAVALLELRRRALELQHLSVRDPLTGLYDRAYLDGALTTELERARRYGYPTSLAVLAVDGFRQISDAHGQAEGERLLTLLAGMLNKGLRAADTVGRYGGQELAAILPHTGVVVAATLAERIRRNVTAAWQGARPPLRSGGTTVTIGVAAFPDEVSDPESLIAAADRRFHAGAAQGGDRVVARDA